MTRPDTRRQGTQEKCCCSSTLS